MKTVSISIGRAPSGYGHKMLIVYLNNEPLSSITSDTRLIDRMDSDDEVIAETAELEAMALVLKGNNVNYSNMRPHSSWGRADYEVDIEQ